MCGIAGELRFSDAPEEADWARISAMMARRGPDDAGLWSGDGRCTLVFRRLAILDLSPNGHQPMTTGNGRYVLVFNGEVYNFAELRRQLVSRGVRFYSSGDSEVVLHALIEWGREALDRFNGMFALGFYDTYEKRLLLARDHAGIKPLYYLIRPQGATFASQYDQLLTHPWSGNLDISQEALGLYLRLAHIPAPYALLQGTYALEPGTWIELTACGQIRRGPFFTFPRYETPSLTGEEAAEAVDAAVTEAVKRHLVSDVPVATFLSGGIDSPLVAAKMSAVSNHSIRAYTIGTEDVATDESPDAMVYARELGIEHTVKCATSAQAISMLDDVIDACGEPFGDYSIFPTMLVSRLASQEFKVILSGDGGDELFWGYAERSGSLLRGAQDFWQPYWWRRTRLKISRALGVGHAYYPLGHPSLGHWYRASHTHLSESWLSRVFPTLPAWPPAYQAFDYKDWELDRTAQWLRWNEYVSHLSMVLLKVDRASMYHSLEVRVPLLDREVIAVAAQVDWRACLDLDQMVGKLPLRHALARHISYQTQAKRGFAVPMGSWLKTSLRGVFEDVVLGRDEILGLPIDRPALRMLFHRHLNGQRDYAWGLWPLLSLALWAERYLCGRDQQPRRLRER